MRILTIAALRNGSHVHPGDPLSGLSEEFDRRRSGHVGKGNEA